MFYKNIVINNTNFFFGYDRIFSSNQAPLITYKNFLDSKFFEVLSGFFLTPKFQVFPGFNCQILYFFRI